MHHPKADVSRMYIPRKEGGRGMINLEMTYKTTTIGLNSYLESSEDRILHAVLQHEKKKKLHSVLKKAGSSRSSIIWLQKKLIQI